MRLLLILATTTVLTGCFLCPEVKPNKIPIRPYEGGLDVLIITESMDPAALQALDKGGWRELTAVRMYDGYTAKHVLVKEGKR